MTYEFDVKINDTIITMLLRRKTGKIVYATEIDRVNFYKLVDNGVIDGIIEHYDVTQYTNDKQAVIYLQNFIDNEVILWKTQQ